MITGRFLLGNTLSTDSIWSRESQTSSMSSRTAQRSLTLPHLATSFASHDSCTRSQNAQPRITPTRARMHCATDTGSLDTGCDEAEEVRAVHISLGCTLAATSSSGSCWNQHHVALVGARARRQRADQKALDRRQSRTDRGFVAEEVAFIAVMPTMKTDILGKYG